MQFELKFGIIDDTMRKKNLKQVALITLLASLSSFAADEAASEKISPEIKEKMDAEVEYIRALMNANMPDIAEPVIEAAKKQWPTLGPKLRVIERQGDLLVGKFDEVNKEIAKIDKKKNPSEFWALKLSVAEAYYSRGMMKECREIFKQFFTEVQNPGPELADFYVESAFKWAQMLIADVNFDEAVKVYGGLLKQKMSDERWCAIALEDVDLLLRLASKINTEELKDAKQKAAQEKQKKAYLDEATKIVDNLLWKEELVLVFGRAISLKAHIELLRGNLEAAQELVNDYMPQLRKIHDTLIEQDPDGTEGYVRMSPMPECRYLLARVMWEAVQKEVSQKKPNEDVIKDSLFGARKGGKRNGAGAFNHAINVFVKFPESTWAASAGELSEKISKFVKDRYNKEIKTNVTKAQMKKVRMMQFANAFQTYKSGDYAKAVKNYSDILVQFPETEEAVNAVANLADSYLQLSTTGKDAKDKEYNRWCADAVEGYLVERFSGINPLYVRGAGDEVLRLAAREHENNQLARAQRLYDGFFEFYPTHYQAAQKLNGMAFDAVGKKDWEKAGHYFSIIANNYTNSTYYTGALYQLSVCKGKAGDEAGQIEWLDKFAATTTKPAEKIPSLLGLANMRQKAGFKLFTDAANTNDVEAAAAMRTQAAKNVLLAIKNFKQVSAEVEKAQNNSLVTAEQKKKFAENREIAMYLEGDSWQRMQFPEDKIKMFRERAVAAFEEYLKVNPKGQYAPYVLVKIGTIWTAEKEMEKSQAAFKRLQENYPESDEAKNSVPRLAKTLIEMGLKNEGVAQYKQMLETTGGKYTAGQFLAAGDALIEARSWDTALEAYQKAMQLTKGDAKQQSILTRATLGVAKTHYGAEHFAEAHAALDAFIGDEKFSKTALVVDAYDMLIEVASEEGRKEKDDDLRMKFFNAAVGAIKKVRNYRPNKEDQDLLDLQSGDVLVRKMEAELAMNKKEQAAETRARAAASFQAFLMAHEPNEEHPAAKMSPTELTNLERAYSTVMPLMAAMGKDMVENVLKYGEAYMELFPEGKHKTDVLNALNQAKAEQ